MTVSDLSSLPLWLLYELESNTNEQARPDFTVNKVISYMGVAISFRLVKTATLDHVACHYLYV